MHGLVFSELKRFTEERFGEQMWGLVQQRAGLGDRVNPNEVVIIYELDRKLCSMAKGIAGGIARHFGERITINELTCMLKGKPSCTIAFTKTT